MPDPIKSHLAKQSLLAPNLDSNLSSAENQKKVKRLLAYVNNADYDNIKKMWKEDPKLMFAEIQLKNGETTTPLKQAFYNLDTYTWKPFYEWLQINRPKLLPEFIKQNAAQEEHVDINPLFKDIYSAYTPQALKWIEGQIDNDEHDRQWNLFVEGQKFYLPKNMLKEMRREGYSWNAKSKFDAALEPKDCEVLFEYKESPTHELPKAALWQFRGNNATRARVGIWRDAVKDGLTGLLADAEILQQLHTVRMLDLAIIPLPRHASEMRLTA